MLQQLYGLACDGQNRFGFRCYYIQQVQLVTVKCFVCSDVSRLPHSCFGYMAPGSFHGLKPLSHTCCEQILVAHAHSASKVKGHVTLHWV